MENPLDPAAPAITDAGLFGLPTPLEHAGVRVIPVPFDATASYRRGAARGPAAVLRASHQVDLFDALTGRPYEEGIWLVDADARMGDWNAEATRLVDEVRRKREESENPFDWREERRRVDEIGSEVNASVHEAVAETLDAARLPIVLGGDHSVAFGSLAAAAEAAPGIGVLHVDAHADLRESYEGFEWSHASVFHNAAQRLDGISTILQVGVRDLSEAEHEAMADLGDRQAVVLDVEWARAKLERSSLREYVRERLSILPDEVYLSFDIDGLDPTLCPNTGTPVPGGLTWHETMLWLEELVASGRRILAGDLVEVSPGRTPDDEDSYDAIVGARLLYRMIGFALRSR